MVIKMVSHAKLSVSDVAGVYQCNVEIDVFNMLCCRYHDCNSCSLEF